MVKQLLSKPTSVKPNLQLSMISSKEKETPLILIDSHNSDRPVVSRRRQKIRFSSSIDKTLKIIAIIVATIIVAAAIYIVCKSVSDSYNAPTVFQNADNKAVAVEVNGKRYDWSSRDFSKMLRIARQAPVHNTEFAEK